MFYADLHVHSKFSRATSRDCDLEHLALWAGKKGITVVATGDFTHPGWLEEIRHKLLPAEPGLHRLRPELEQEARRAGTRTAGDVRFVLQVEISTIYKRDGRTRKVHHLIYVPDFEAAQRLHQSLARIGNLGSDGRPILGLDSRSLLEIALECGEGCYLVPAHIWTPWFAVLGSKSGFDSIEHCYGDLTSEVFALETGLSSDPAMNWRLSALDRFALVSNSDAHSPPKLGREACVFETELDYFAMRRALQTGAGYGGTVEFFPEEGKYHFDGHRKCNVCLSPDETRRHHGDCPVCGKPLTLGVMYRVCELADRERAPEPRPARAAPFRSLIPLEEVLAEICGVGPQSIAVQRKYEELLARIGPELFILEKAPLEEIARAGSPLLAEAVMRMRQGRVICQAGFDGEYGTIRLFTKEELARGSSVGLLFEMPEEAQTRQAHEPASELSRPGAGGQTSALLVAQPPPVVPDEGSRGQPHQIPRSTLTANPILDQLDAQQRAAAETVAGPVLIVAGPGTGKTRTLTHRLAHLVAHGRAAPEQCLALTFSRRAAQEMAERLERLLPSAAHRVPVMTFHSLGLSMLREHGGRLGLDASLRVASEAERADLLARLLALSPAVARQRLQRISRRKRREPAAGPFEPADTVADAAAYERELRARAWLDFDDLIALPLCLLRQNPDLVQHYRARYRWVSVDEFQDLDAAQYELVRLLVAPEGNLCVIGDPDQAIYGFRGADVRCFQRFQGDFPSARTIMLTRNYRSTQTICDAALQLIAPSSLVAQRQLQAECRGPQQVEIHECPTERAEAELVVHTIERLIGGSTFFSLDSQRVEGHEGESLSFADLAVLYRAETQAEALVEAFERSGMPFQCRTHDPLADRPFVQEAIRAMSEARGSAGDEATVLERLNRAAEAVAAQDEASLAALRARAARHESDLAQFLSEIALGADVDLWDPRADRVSLLTLHAAKGLEFPVVFLVGCEDGILPLHWGPADPQIIAEERRLFFVGMTRARLRLILTHARRRRWRGTLRDSAPSPFLCDIQRELLALHEHRPTRRPVPADRQGTLFD